MKQSVSEYDNRSDNFTKLLVVRDDIAFLEVTVIIVVALLNCGANWIVNPSDEESEEVPFG